MSFWANEDYRRTISNFWTHSTTTWLCNPVLGCQHFQQDIEFPEYCCHWQLPPSQTRRNTGQNITIVKQTSSKVSWQILKESLAGFTVMSGANHPQAFKKLPFFGVLLHYSQQFLVMRQSLLQNIWDSNMGLPSSKKLAQALVAGIPQQRPPACKKKLSTCHFAVLKDGECNWLSRTPYSLTWALHPRWYI